MNDLPRWLKGLMIVALSFQLTTCGTIMHPERRGQTGGRLDPGVVILDAVGLLFFIIPGVIAFAVDISNGTIYLPGTRAGMGSQGPRTVRFDPSQRSPELLKRIIREQTGYDLDWQDTRLRVSELHGADEIPAALAQIGTAASQRAPAVIVRSDL